MTARVEVEDIEVTRGERLLAFVLAGFLLVGGVWAYARLDLTDGGPVPPDPLTRLSAAERAALDRRDAAARRAASLRRLVRERRAALADDREAYRTALDEGRRDPRLARRYRAAQARYASAQAEARRRGAQARRARAAARPVEARLARVERDLARVADSEHRRDVLLTAALRLALVLGALTAALRLMAAQRRRRSRWAVGGYAAVGAAAALGFVMGVDYVTDWIDPVDLGPLVLSVAGAALTLVALAVLQRYLAQRLPSRRVRRGECPFCGFPIGRGDHCEGCGRAVVAPCGRCAAPRRVGTAHCAACGGT